MQTSTLNHPPAPGLLRLVPFIRTEASALIALFALVVMTAGWAGSIGVYHFGANRAQMAYVNFWAFDFSLLGMLTTPWLPLPSLKHHSSYQRLEFMIQVWVCTYVAIAFTFEIPWLLLLDRIAAAPNEPWAYQWWSYIDGGDVRYKNPDSLVLFAETWTSLNGFLSAIAITRWFRSGKTSKAAVYYLMLGAAGHITTTVQYFSTEILTGFPNEDIHVISNFWAKFVFSNCAWLIMPFATIAWGTQALRRLYTQEARNIPDTRTQSV